MIVIITREELLRQIEELAQYIHEKNITWHKQTRPIEEKHLVIESASHQLKAKNKLLNELVVNFAHAVLYELDGNYKLIRKIII